MASDIPEASQSRRDSQALQSAPGKTQRAAQVLDFRFETLQPLALFGTAQRRLPLLRQGDAPVTIPLRDASGRSFGGQLFGGILAQCLQEAITLFRPVRLGNDQRFFDQQGEQIENAVGIQAVAGADLLAGFQGPATGEKTEAMKKDYSGQDRCLSPRKPSCKGCANCCRTYSPTSSIKFCP